MDRDSNINKEYTFDSFVVGKCNDLAQAAALAVAENPGEVYNPLFLYGPSGLGKTHLMHAIGNYVIEHQPELSVYYTVADDMVDELVTAIRRGETEGIAALEKK